MRLYEDATLDADSAQGDAGLDDHCDDKFFYSCFSLGALVVGLVIWVPPDVSQTL
ncbi:hypothetical protein [Pseudomonas marginalis]|uniref:hypothetical protein n=1 Tax=Pseudomonas marginalis TaxID=298 RepID=UPI003BA0D843